MDLLINTHCHYDHAGADHDFVMEFGCEVAIHRIEAKYLRDGDFHFTLSELFFGERMRAVEVSRELEDGDVIDLGELKLQVLHTPGHTAGSICLYEPERRMLFSGDTVFADG
ncbi:MAG: MBL fold metallo-hydrolase, partial [Candidatus Hadarchaeales archaeon]